MQQSLYQLQSELQIDSSHERHRKGYLAYIKSKYPIKDKGNIDSIRKEWQLNFDCSQNCNHDDNSRISNDSEQKSSFFLRDDCPEEVLEFVLAPESYSDSVHDFPNIILFDNFVVDGSRDCSVDFGQYIPTGVNNSRLEESSNGKDTFVKGVRRFS